jgi:hypothetical protein
VHASPVILPSASAAGRQAVPAPTRRDTLPFSILSGKLISEDMEGRSIGQTGHYFNFIILNQHVNT